MDPKKMEAMMRQMGINQKNIDAERVVIEQSSGSKIIIDNPSVVEINMKGSKSFQVSGDISESDEQSETGFTEEDITTVMEKTGASEEEVRKALEKTGDLAEAIMELSE